MSNYTQTTFFAPKDALTTGNAAKVIKGSEVDVELGAISTAVATKLDSGSVASNAQADALASDTVFISPLKLLRAIGNGNFTTAPGFISTLTNDAAPDGALDYVMTFDFSAGQLKKATPSALLTASGSVPTSRQIIAGAGLSGGGTLAADRTLSIPANGITTTMITDANVTLAKIVNVTDNRILGRAAGSSGVATELTVANGLSMASGVVSGNVYAVYKTAQTARTTTITQADDTHLIVASLPAGTYTIDCVLFFSDGSAAGAGGVQYGFRRAGSSTGNEFRTLMGYVNAANLALPNTLLTSVTQHAAWSSATNSDYVKIGGCFSTSTAGDFAVQWSQKVSTAGNLVLQDRSYMVLTKIA